MELQGQSLSAVSRMVFMSEKMIFLVTPIPKGIRSDSLFIETNTYRGII